MSMSLTDASRFVRPAVDYPECDGNLMSDNTTHGDAIEYFHGVVSSVVADDDNAFAAADHLWYYREGDPMARVAPDVYVVFGRPKGHRGRYLQWEEKGLAPHVVFEVVSPRNRASTNNKLFLYDELGVEEYYVYDPGYDRRGRLKVENRALRGFRRNAAGRAEIVENAIGSSSGRLGIRFDWDEEGLLLLLRSDGSAFPRYTAALAQATAAEGQTRAAEARAASLQAQLDRLRKLGVDVDSGADV